MMRTRDIGGAIWAFFGFEVVSGLIHAVFVFLTTRVGSFVLALMLGMYAWHVLGPEPKRLDSTRLSLANEACAEALEKLPYDKSLYRVAVLPFDRDYTSYVSDTLRRKLAETGRYNVRDKGAFERLWRKLNLDPGEIVGPDAAQAAGKRMKMDAVVFGSVPEQAQDSDQVKLLLNVTMLRVSTGEKIADFAIERTLGKSLLSPTYVETKMRSQGVMARFGLWAVICLVLPLLFSFVIRYITQVESNVFNFLMLAGFVLANVILGILIMEMTVTTFRGCLAMLIIACISAAYNYAACTRIDELSR